jgi:non-ribosomal peptide synthetase component F
MQNYVDGKPVSDDASRVCLLFDPKSGRVVHGHTATALHSPNTLTEAELEERARKYARHFGHSVGGLRALHLPLAAVRQPGRLRVNAAGTGLVPAPPTAPRDRQRPASAV